MTPGEDAALSSSTVKLRSLTLPLPIPESTQEFRGSPELNGACRRVTSNPADRNKSITVERSMHMSEGNWLGEQSSASKRCLKGGSKCGARSLRSSIICDVNGPQISMIFKMRDQN